MKKNAYEVEKNIDRLWRGDSTGFLTFHVFKEIQAKLKKKDFQVFSPYPEADKVILQGNKNQPEVRLYQIDCYEKEKKQISHSAILGSLLGMNITNEMFGDIVFYEGNFYIYFLEKICDFVVQHFDMVGRIPIRLVEVDIDFLKNYQRKYEEYKLIVTSMRIDSVIARLIGCNRDSVKKMIQEKLVLLNGEVLNRNSYVLQEGDIFSVRKYGKYRYYGILGTTKKQHFVITVKKYT